MTDRTSKIKTSQGTLEEQKTQIKVSRQSRAEAKEGLVSAGALDAKVVSAFDVESSDLAANIDALTRAISALEKNAAGSSFPSGRRRFCHSQVGHESEQGVRTTIVPRCCLSCRAVTVREAQDHGYPEAIEG